MNDALISTDTYLGAAVRTIADSLPTVAGTLSVAIQLRLDGDADDGKFWDTNAGGSWQASPTTLPTATHRGYGWWDYLLPAAAIASKEHGVIRIVAIGDQLTAPATETLIPGLADTAVVVKNYRNVATLEALKTDHTTADTFGELLQQGTVVTGAAVKGPAESYVLTTGTQSSGTVGDTKAVDAVYHEHTDVGGAMDLYYQFDIGGDGLPTGITVVGRLNSANDDLDGIYAWDWSASGWDRIGDYNGKNGSADVTRTYDLLTTHVGSGVNLGKVRVRFFRAAGMTSATMRVDQIIVSYAVTSRTVGYADGAIWVDTVNGTAGVEPYVNGVADKPVSTWADALALSTALGLKRFRIGNGSSITLSGGVPAFTLVGNGWSLNLNGQNCANAHFMGASIVGNAIGAGMQCTDCDLADGTAMTMASLHAHRCGIAGDLIFAGPFFMLDQCFSAIAGIATPSIDVAVTDMYVNFRHYSGGIEVKGMGLTGTDNMSLEGVGQLVINANCIAGTIAIRGNFTVTDNSGGSVTLSDDARMTRSETADLTDTVLTSAHGAGSWAGGSSLTQQNVRDAMLLSPTAGAPAAGSVDEHLDDMPTDVDTTLTSAHGAGSWTAASGSGALAVTVHLDDAVPAPVPQAGISVYDSTNTLLITQGTTDIAGDVDFNLDPGTYQLRIVAPGYTFTVPETIVATVDATFTLSGTVLTITPPADPTMCAIYGTLRDAAGKVHAGVCVEVYSVAPQAVGGIQHTERIASIFTDADGFFQIELQRESRVQVKVEEAQIDAIKDVPDAATQDLTSWADAVL